jgi:hypothetical protein
MKVAIHQPCFLPWLGYLDRMRRSDLFVLLDHVQFERRGYQNRTSIRVEDEARWLTVPVVQVSQKETILEKRIDNPVESLDRWWGSKAFQTLRFAYRKAPYFKEHAPRVQAILETRHEKLVDINQAMLDFLREAYAIRTPLVRSSELQVEGQRSGLLLSVCKAVGATTFLGGMGGSRNYLDQDQFNRSGVDVEWQAFEHPKYAQCGAAGFIPGLAALDMLFNCGPAAPAMLAGKDWQNAGERLAA